MTAREDLIGAAEALEADGRSPFSPAELIVEARGRGSTYSDQTIRSVLLGYLSAPDGDASLGPSRPFARVSRGRYRLAILDGDRLPAGGSGSTTTSAPRPVATSPTAASSDDAPGYDWMWEGNVQAAVVSKLVSGGWSIVRVADTESREQGHDIVAERSGQRLLIEVKGYPSTHYARGPRKGEAKTTAQAAPARTYFSNALLTGHLMRSEHPDAHVVLAFPAKGTYEGLARRLVGTLKKVGIEVWLVDASGNVTVADR